MPSEEPELLEDMLIRFIPSEENLEEINEILLKELFVQFHPLDAHLPPPHSQGYVVYEANIDLELKDTQIEEFDIEKHQRSHLHELIYWEGHLVIRYFMEDQFIIEKFIKMTVSGTDFKFAFDNDVFNVEN